MKERNYGKSAEKKSVDLELERVSKEQQEKIREKHETKAERQGETGRESLEKSRERAYELAGETEKKKLEKNEKLPSAEKVPDVQPKAARDKAYKRTMAQVRSNLSPAGRTFSKVIHNPVVESVSEVTGKTIARPNSILSGSMLAFFVVLLTYLVARHYGYPLSGSETILAFALGWVLGIIFDWLRGGITGRAQL